MTSFFDKFGILRFKLPPDFQGEVREYLRLMGGIMSWDKDLSEIRASRFMDDVYKTAGAPIHELLTRYSEDVFRISFEQSYAYWALSELHDYDHSKPDPPFYGHAIERIVLRPDLMPNRYEDPDLRKYIRSMIYRLRKIDSHFELWNVRRDHPEHNFGGKYKGMCDGCQEFQK